MKKRGRFFSKSLALMLSIMIILTMMPVYAWAESGDLPYGSAVTTSEADVMSISLNGDGTENNPYIIRSAEDLMSLNNQDVNGFYALDGDIDMAGQAMKPIRSFKGTLDGNGHLIKNLTIETTSGCAGLIADFKGGSIKNLVLEEVRISAKGSQSYTGGLAGKITGVTVIDTCGIESGSILNTNSSNAPTGGLVGYVSSNLTIQNCYSKAEVNAKQYVGGLVGRVYSVKLQCLNSYVSGNVTTEYTSPYTYAGGISGSSSTSSSYENCYFAGNISHPNTTDMRYIGAICGSNTSFGTFANCYYNSELLGFEEAKYSVTKKSTAEMNDAAFVADLGNAYTVKAGDYPILKWQDPNATYTVIFNVTPVDSTVTLNDVVQEVNGSGIYTVGDLKSGESLSYIIEQADGTVTDLKTETGTIVVGKSDVTKVITLKPNTYSLGFTVAPENAGFKVKDASNAELVSVSGSQQYNYNVVNGVYTYEVNAFGYESKNGEVTINRADSVSNSISLQEKAKRNVNFVFSKDGKPVDANIFNIDVFYGDNKAEVTDGVVSLYDGYEYSYVIKNVNYKTVKGTATSGSGIIEIQLEEKTAWEGKEDILEPATDEDGICRYDHYGVRNILRKGRILTKWE